ncbi:MAG TPA: glycine betaine ABC transporter substrate-binding protein [Acidimicrobiia bacterium]|nr:glycine betaine ABC transporter substrate-binding protein [Acidimicrobiia bacterium]
MQEAPKRLTSRLVAIFAVLAMVVAACGGDDADTTTTAGNGDDGTTAPSGGDAAFDEYDLSGIEISVGSKDFDEQLVLGNMLKVAFEYAGATVEDNINLGGTNLAREALVNGDIDTYVEYNGTGYAVHLAIEEEIPGDPEELTSVVRERDLEENGIHWLSRAPFNNTYGFVSSPDVTAENDGEAYDFQGMADYLEANPDATLCLESEFPNRDDGLILFEEATGYTVPDDQIDILDTGLIYTETAANTCHFGEVFTTDGRIQELDITLVDDPGVMILYNVSINLRDDLYQEAPDAFDAMAEAMLSGLTQERMTDLNYQVSSLGESPEAVATEYLVSEGLISG